MIKRLWLTLVVSFCGAGMADAQTLKSSQPEQQEAAVGHWIFKPGDKNIGTAGELGWVAAEDVEERYSQISFRCPDNGDDIWVLVDRQHDSADAVPVEVALAADGAWLPLRLMPQIDDQTGRWYAIGAFGRDTSLFAQLVGAGSVAMEYGEEWVPLVLNGPTPQDDAALERFMKACGIPVAR